MPAEAARASSMIAANEARRAGGVQARAGDLVLVRRSARSSGARVVRVLGRPDVAAASDRGPDARSRAAPRLRRGRRARGAPGGRARRARSLQGATCASWRPSRSTRPAHATSTTRSRPSGSTARRCGCGCTSPTSAAHVPEGSLVDREARRRSTSVYVPGAVEPMLPEALSNDACSLMPGRRAARR